MKKTIENITTNLSTLNLACTLISKNERTENFKTFKTNTLEEITKNGFVLNSKESNLFTSAYGMKNAFVTCLKDDKMLLCENENDETVKAVYSKTLRFASAQVEKALKNANDSIYSTYEMVKLNNYDLFNVWTENTLNIKASKHFFTFLKAYMFTTEKELSKKAYVKKFIDLLIALKEYQGTYSLKFEKVTFKHIIKDIKVSSINLALGYTYEDLKALVSLTDYKNELVNDNMILDTKVLNKAKKDILFLTEEEEKVFYEIFK